VQTLELTEGHDTAVPATDLPESVAIALRRSKMVTVEFPDPFNQRRYILRPTTHVGLVPIGADLMIRIQPKVPVSNLFGMLEVVHGLASLRFYSGIGRVSGVEDIYERLAELLARGVNQRIRRGLYSDFVHRSDDLMVLRGRLDVPNTLRLRARASARVRCHYSTRTIDIPDNRILLWTLDRIPRLGLPNSGAMKAVHAARRALLGSVTLRECTAGECRGRQYNRLNADYEVLHALARFFLDHMGPAVAVGDRHFIPFTANMAQLFQEYVVACLRRAAPPGITVYRQHRVELKGDWRVEYQMDAVIADERSGETLAVIDAKYKPDRTPQTDDVQQVVAYCAHLGATRAFLVYPNRLSAPGRVVSGARSVIEVRAIALPLGDELQSAARQFADSIFSSLPTGAELIRSTRQGIDPEF
jgi:5-methylcytosine-specific restriction enzyme subunit McrC